MFLLEDAVFLLIENNWNPDHNAITTGNSKTSLLSRKYAENSARELKDLHNAIYAERLQVSFLFLNFLKALTLKALYSFLCMHTPNGIGKTSVDIIDRKAPCLS